MNGVLVDSCVLLDLVTDDPLWADWSESILETYSKTNTLYINSIIYAEVSIGFQEIEQVESVVEGLRLKVLEMPREALFLAGKVFLKYRKKAGSKTSPLPDFLIGSHAAVANFGLITRDIKKYNAYFSQLQLIEPANA